MKKNNDMLNKYFEDANNEMLDLNIYLHQQEVNSNTFCFSLQNGQVLYFTPYGFVKCFLYFQMDGYHFYLTTQKALDINLSRDNGTLMMKNSL